MIQSPTQVKLVCASQGTAAAVTVLLLESFISARLLPWGRVKSQVRPPASACIEGRVTIRLQVTVTLPFDRRTTRLVDSLPRPSAADNKFKPHVPRLTIKTCCRMASNREEIDEVKVEIRQSRSLLQLSKQEI